MHWFLECEEERKEVKNVMVGGLSLDVVGNADNLS